MRIGLILSLLFTGLPSLGQEVLHIRSLDTVTNLNPYLSYYLDEDKSKDLSDITTLSSGYFVSMDSEGLRLPKTNAQIWLKLTCLSTLDVKEEFIIDFIDPSLYVMELYRVNKGGSFETYTSGTSVTQNEKTVKGNRNNFRLTLEPGQELSIFIKIHSTNNMTISAELMHDHIARERIINERTFIGLFYGAMMILMIYNLLLFFITKFRVFLFNGLYAFLVALFTGSADGFTAQYFHFFVVWTSGYHDAYIATGCNIVGLFFMRDFLKISEWSKGYDRGIKWFIYGILVVLVLVSIIYLQSVFVFLSYISILVLLVTIFIGALAVKWKQPQAVYFLTAYLVFGAFILIFILSILRIFPYGTLVKYSIHFGYLSSICILSYGLSVKLYELYRELIRKEKEKKILIELKNQELEEKVTQRTHYIQKKELNLRSILDNTDSSIWLVDNRYKIIEFNKVFFNEWKLAYDVEVEIGKNILELIPDEATRTLWKERYRDALNNNRAVYQDSYTLGGTEHYYEIHVFPISYGDTVTGISFFSKDISKRVNAQKQLIKQNQILTKVNKELDSFVYSASHDLKAPLASVLGLISLIRKEENEANKEQYYNMMEQSIVRLDQFIKDIIDYSRNSRVGVQIEEIDLKQLILNSFDDLKYIEGSEQTAKVINMPDDLKVTSDPTRLRVIVRNILSNAIKYGHKPGNEKKIEIEASKKNGSLVLSIVDNGPGIPKDQQDKIFDMFYRLHESKSGTGLGLYIVKETVDRLKGKINIKSVPEKGACFEITLPNSTFRSINRMTKELNLKKKVKAKKKFND
ncbi:MAG: ATP-binding protein [Bacteroidota bacterium]